MKEAWEEQKEIEDSLKVCREIQEFLKREKKVRGNVRVEMSPGTRSDIDRILSQNQKSASIPEPEPEETGFKPELKLEDEPAEPELKLKPETAKPELELELEPEVESPIISDDFSTTDNTEAEYNERHPFLNMLLHIGICIGVALILALLITKFVAHHTSVEGSSMETTLANGDQLIVENISYYLHEPERFDVIVFPYNDEVNYIKRIIGLPGETVQILNGCIYINGEILDESYGREEIDDPGLAAEEIQLGEDEYFVLGDNRNASIDSRREEVGTVHRSDIKGKAWLRFYPMDRVSLVE